MRNSQDSDKIQILAKKIGIKTQIDMGIRLYQVLHPKSTVKLDYSQIDSERKKVGSILNDERDLSITEALALAKLLNTTVSELLNEDTLTLETLESSLETRFFPFDPKSLTRNEKVSEYFKEISKEGRISVYSRFPSSIYISEAEKDIYDLFAKEQAPTHEYYTVDSIIQFAFSPFTGYTKVVKIKAIERLLSVITKPSNSVHFFGRLLGLHNQNVTNFNLSKITLGQDKLLKIIIIGLTLPGIHAFLEIHNALVYDKICDLLKVNEGNKFSDKEPSIAFIQLIEKLLKNSQGTQDFLNLPATISFDDSEEIGDIKDMVNSVLPNTFQIES